MNLEHSYSQRALSATISLPDINKPKPLAGEELDQGYESNKDRVKSKFIRFNDAFKYITPLPTHTRSTKTLAENVIRGAMGKNYKYDKNINEMKSKVSISSSNL